MGNLSVEEDVCFSEMLLGTKSWYRSSSENNLIVGGD